MLFLMLGSTFCIGPGIHISITRTTTSDRRIINLLATTGHCKCYMINLICSYMMKIIYNRWNRHLLNLLSGNGNYIHVSVQFTVSSEYLISFLGFCDLIWSLSFFCQFINLLDYRKYLACNISF
jgi:hypothetical protein